MTNQVGLYILVSLISVGVITVYFITKLKSDITKEDTVEMSNDGVQDQPEWLENLVLTQTLDKHDDVLELDDHQVSSIQSANTSSSEEFLSDRTEFERFFQNESRSDVILRLDKNDAELKLDSEENRLDSIWNQEHEVRNVTELDEHIIV